MLGLIVSAAVFPRLLYPMGLAGESWGKEVITGETPRVLVPFVVVE